jgi:DNA-binding MarR family transcriptional regulator
MRTHHALRRELDTELAAEHELTVSEFEVLLLLSRADQRSMRRIDLANEVRLSPSGITRMLDRLGANGFVDKRACEADARVSYAVLTDEGLERFREVIPGHYAAIERLLASRLSDQELDQLAELLDRLAGADGEPCLPGDSA